MNKIKKRTIGCVTLIMFLLLGWDPSCYGLTYYVSSSGNDAADGLSDKTAWRTIDRVNKHNYEKGDYILFRRGDVFSDKRLTLKGVLNLIVADYGGGSKPLLEGNSKQPILISDSKQIVIRNINISGQQWQSNKAANLSIKNVEDILLDGIDGDGFWKGGKTAGKTAVQIKDCSGMIEIKNCNLVNWGPPDMPVKSKDFMGVALINVHSGQFLIHDNMIHNINADCLHIYDCKVPGSVYNNRLSNAGEDSIDIKGSSYVKVFNNFFFRSDDFIGEGGTGSGGTPTYIGIHSANHKSAHDNTIQGNIFFRGDCAAIKIVNAAKTDILNNFFSNTRSSLYILNKVSDTFFHHNFILNPESRLNPKDIDTGCIYENNSFSGTRISNNTILNEKGSCKQLISIACCKNTTVFENIVVQTSLQNEAYCLNYLGCGERPGIYRNLWYHPGSTNRIKIKDRLYHSNAEKLWQLSHAGDLFFIPEAHINTQTTESMLELMSNLHQSTGWGVDPEKIIYKHPFALKQ